MSPVTYAFGIVAAVLALAAVIELMRRGTLRERHAVWWFVGGVLALVVAVFPQVLGWAAQVLGVNLPANLVFFVAIGLLFLVSLQYGAELTRVEAKMRVLAEQSAFHEHRIRLLEQGIPAIERSDKAAEAGTDEAWSTDKTGQARETPEEEH